MRTGVLRPGLVSVSVLAVLSACATTEGPSSRLDEAGAVVAEALDEARAAGAGAAQLADLSAAAESGTLSVESAREAARRAVTCMQQAGIEAEYLEDTLSHGLVLPGYTAHYDTEVDVQSDLQVEACDEQEFRWVNQVYQLQPSSLEAIDAHVEQRAPAILACLVANGIEASAEETGAELAQKASQAAYDSLGEVSCLADAGIDVW